MVSKLVFGDIALSLVTHGISLACGTGGLDIEGASLGSHPEPTLPHCHQDRSTPPDWQLPFGNLPSARLPTSGPP